MTISFPFRVLSLGFYLFIRVWFIPLLSFFVFPLLISFPFLVLFSDIIWFSGFRFGFPQLILCNLSNWSDIIWFSEFRFGFPQLILCNLSTWSSDLCEEISSGKACRTLCERPLVVAGRKLGTGPNSIRTALPIFCFFLSL